jgi:hypothetical protein
MPSGTADLKAFIREFDKFPKELRQELRPKLRKTGEKALASVRALAGWSTRVPGATRLSVSFAKRNPGISIVVNRHKAPHARPHEHGGKPGFFRAPLFGNRRRWYRHRARPFLEPGARPHFERVDNEIKDAVDEAARKAGFR